MKPTLLWRDSAVRSRVAVHLMVSPPVSLNPQCLLAGDFPRLSGANVLMGLDNGAQDDDRFKAV